MPIDINFNICNSLVKSLTSEAINISIHDYTFSINDFNLPKEYENAQAVMSLLTRLLLLNPGTIQSHPNMGVGLVQNYRYSLQGAEVQLQADYRNQIDTYLPQFTGAEVAVKFRDHQFQIFVQINNTAFAWLYDIDEDQITANYSRLSDL